MAEQETIDFLKRKIQSEKHLKLNNNEHYNMAIKVLEKQIAKKPINHGCADEKGVWHTWNGINGVPYDLCPNCEINLCTDGALGRDKSKMKYCENCGQKLDWE